MNSLKINCLKKKESKNHKRTYNKITLIFIEDF